MHGRHVNSGHLSAVSPVVVELTEHARDKSTVAEVQVTPSCCL